MRCTNCGYESAEDFAFCQRCGAAAPEVAPKNPAADRVFTCLKDNLFLALCILLTVSGAITLGSGGGIPVIIVLAAIFSWLAYADAKKGIVNVKHLRCISGTVYANYVIANVGGIICIVCGALSAALIPFGGMISLFEIKVWFSEIAGVDISDKALAWMLPVLAAALICAGVLVLVINILTIRKIHRFIKSVYLGVKSGNTEFYSPRAARTWLIVFTSFMGVSTLIAISEEFLAAVSSGCLVAALIITVILINKYFIEKQ